MGFLTFTIVEHLTYMYNPKPREIAVTVGDLKVGFRIPLHLFFIWMIKKFWIQQAQLLSNNWRYLIAYVWLYHKSNISLKANAFRAHTKLSQRMCSLGYVYISYKT